MSIRHLSHLFHPGSVALIGATPRPHSVGATALANLKAGGFRGPIHLVNPKYRELDGQPCHASVDDLPACPELALICTPAPTVPRLIAALGRRGCRAAIVLSAGFEQQADAAGGSLRQAVLDASRPYQLRILGPNCVGLIVPGIGLNASFANTMALPGKLAFASQSGALTTAVLDWSRSRQIGFSYFISLGDSADVDLADVLDYLAGDPATHAILLYVEAVRSGRKFMSAARAAARNKPVLIVKAGRVPEGAKAAASHTGALAGADDVYDAAIRRAGMLRVDSTEDLFDAVETLARARPLNGERLGIVTNGGGAGVMATDALVRSGGRLAVPDADILRQLDEVLPPTWSHGNPIDIVGDAPIERYVRALQILQACPATDATLLIHAPTAIVPSTDIAEAVVQAAPALRQPLFTSWLGGDAVAQARQICRRAGIPTYETPEQAVRGFLQTVEYQRNLELLMQTPPATPAGRAPETARVRGIVRQALAEGRPLLSEVEAKTVLAAYGIPVVETRLATDAGSAAAMAQALGFPVALKIVSPDVTHKSDVGGVALDLASADEVRAAAAAMQDALRAHRPEARLTGFSVQRMVRRAGAFELIVGAACDPVFGPVLLFGQGGTAVERIGDRAVGLPPLNPVLAGELVKRTRISRLLAGYRDKPPADLEALYAALIRVSQLVCDIAEVAELDINPLIADEHGVLALDARIGVRVAQGPAARDPAGRLSILPYPQALEASVTWNHAPLLLRPVRPDDEPAYRAFLDSLTPEDLHQRYLCMFRHPPHSQLARMTQIDYAREMCFVAVAARPDGPPAILGECRAVADSDNIRAEFAVSVRSDCKGKGLGRLLADKIIAYSRAHGTRELVGTTLPGNQPMLALARACGFAAQHTPDGVQLRRMLSEDHATSEVPQ